MEAWHTASSTLLHRLLLSDQRRTCQSAAFPGGARSFLKGEAAGEVKMLKRNHFSIIKATAGEKQRPRLHSPTPPAVQPAFTDVCVGNAFYLMLFFTV